MIFMKCDVNLFKNDDIKFITFISIIHRQYMIYLNNYLKKEGITASHAPILSYLLYKDISCQEEIGNHFKIYQLSLTEKGRAVALKIMDLNNEWENQIYSTCNTDEKQIVELMRKITISSINIQKNTQKEEKNG